MYDADMFRKGVDQGLVVMGRDDSRLGGVNDKLVLFIWRATFVPVARVRVFVLD